MNMDYKLGEENTYKCFKGLGQILNLLAKCYKRQIQEISLLFLQYKYLGILLTVIGSVQNKGELQSISFKIIMLPSTTL